VAKIPMGQGGVDVCLTYEVDVNAMVVAIDCDPSLCRHHHCRRHCGSCISCPSCQPRLEPQESVNATPNATVQEMHVHELELIDGVFQRSCCRRCGCGYCASAAPGVFNPSRNKVTSCWTSAARRMRSSSDSCWSFSSQVSLALAGWRQRCPQPPTPSGGHDYSPRSLVAPAPETATAPVTMWANLLPISREWQRHPPPAVSDVGGQGGGWAVGRQRLFRPCGTFPHNDGPHPLRLLSCLNTFKSRVPSPDPRDVPVAQQLRLEVLRGRGAWGCGNDGVVIGSGQCRCRLGRNCR